MQKTHPTAPEDGRQQRAELLLIGTATLLVIALVFAVWRLGRPVMMPHPAGKSATYHASDTPAVTPASLGDIVVNDCPADAKAWCKVFSAKYQLGVSYPPGWRSSVVPEDRSGSGEPSYDISLAPSDEQVWYSIVTVYPANLAQAVEGARQGLEGKDLTVTTTGVTIQGHQAVRLDYKAYVGFSAKTPMASTYLIADGSNVLRFDFVLHEDTPELSAATSQKIFDSLQIL